MQAFLNNTLLAQPQPLLDGVCLHSYNNDGGNDWTQPGFLNQTLWQARDMLEIVQKTLARNPQPGPPKFKGGVWCGECGPCNDGGRPNRTALMPPSSRRVCDL